MIWQPNSSGRQVWAKGILACKLVFLCFVVVLTNAGLTNATQLDPVQSSWPAVAALGAIWLAALIGLWAVVVEPNHLARVLWGFIIAASGAFAWGYMTVSQRTLDVFGILLMWDARNFTGNAAANHSHQVQLAIVLGLLTWAVLALPPLRTARRGAGRLTPLVPAVPVALIMGVVAAGAGQSPAGLPAQFAQAAMAMMVTGKNAFAAEPQRRTPDWQPHANGFRKIVVLVDESIRPDYLDPGGATGITPEFAEAARRMVDFGPAVSGSVCSSYSNAILRFVAARGDLGGAINDNPTLFSFAKRAGYRTVYIDAQAHALKNGDLLQNFMSETERADIDGFYPLADAKPDEADHRLADIVTRELASGGKVFIYANKQGAHFPYDINYPAGETIFHPSVAEAGEKSYISNIASYRNAIRWNVDRFFGRLFASADLRQTFLVYTSDHGQSLDPTGLAHCAASDASPRMGLVPLFVFADDAATLQRLRRGADRSRGRASHFQIAPSLLAGMGYDEADILRHSPESLTAGTSRPPAFTMGDIFGLFSPRASWQAVDLNRNYAEFPVGPDLPGATASLTRRPR